ncbi:hypothetical protein PR048_032798 [Dryococelus australis]|uniref:Uncharacterized protein n=1 Tax=Dryococelus australis TaxID=614101 RepID=A0ABQ9G617_9NEOP|nr:hypothetical protein PR048_032798 [Dryococelus australis]
MVCVDGQPLNIVENRGFTKLISHLEPRFTMPSRKTLTNVIIRTMYDSADKNVESRICCNNYRPMDFYANTDFSSVTAQYVNKELVLQHPSLIVVPFPEVSHTAEKISKFLTSV